MTEHILHNETDILLRITHGDQTAFAELFNQFQPIIYSYVLRLSRNETLAQEIVQDTFLKTWLKRESLAEISNIRSWLFRVAANATYDALRRQANANENLQAFKKQQEMQPAKTFTPTEEFLLQQEYRQLLYSAISILPERQREALRLVKMEGFTRYEAAKRMGISPESVKTNVTIAMQKVRAHCMANMDSLGMLIFLWATR